MLRNPKWWVGFVTSTLFSVWTVAFLLGLSNYLSMGDAFAVMYLTMGVFVLMVLLMLLWLFSKRMRPVSFGLAIPLLGCCVWASLFFESNEILSPQALLFNLPFVAAFLAVGIVYMTSNSHVGRQRNALNPRDTQNTRSI